MKTTSPIVMFTFNRPWHSRQTIESLRKAELADQSDLIVFSDGPREEIDAEKVKDVRSYLDSIQGFKSVTIKRREENYGLARSVITGTSDVIDEYGRAIIVEDDLILSRYYLRYMNKALDYYEKYKNIFSVTGYCPPLEIPSNYEFDTYLFYRCNSWGWGTWSDRWKKVDWSLSDFDSFACNLKEVRLFNRGGDDLFEMLKQQVEGFIDSWAIIWCYAHFKNDAFCVYPNPSLVRNIGFDGSGIHEVDTNFYDVQLSESNLIGIRFCGPDAVNEEIVNRFQDFHAYPLPKKLRKLFRLNVLRKIGIKL